MTPGGSNVYNSLRIHPPDNPTKRAFCFVPGDVIYEPKPYLIRNRDIVDQTDLTVAAPFEFEEQLRSGTWSTIRYAARIVKPLIVVLPDGALRGAGWVRRGR